jgi:hypothetical protein
MNTFSERLKALVDWWPLILLIQQAAVARHGREQATAVTQILRFLASKTEIETDDRLVEHVQKVFATPEGGELIDYVVTLVNRPVGV